MTVSAFCPGHISCIFQPVPSMNPVLAGSRGVGIRLNLGSHVSVDERDDGDVRIVLDGEPASAHITREAVRAIAPDRGFDIRIDNDLPMGQGFGTSASGALAASICVADIVGVPRVKALEAAHVAEVTGGGGLGDVTAIVSGGDVPIRMRAGFPPFGSVSTSGIRFSSLTVAVLGPKVPTGSVLGSPGMMARIHDASESSMEEFLSNQDADGLFRASNMFSSGAGLEGPGVSNALSKLKGRGYRAGMCMLGNSVFTDAPVDAVLSAFGRANIRAFCCSSSSSEIRITRRG